MKKLVQAIFKVTLLVFLLQPMFTVPSQAGLLGNILSGGTNFIQEAKNQELPINEGQLQEDVYSFYSVFTIIGAIITVLIGAVLGIKFLLGSIEEQAQTKDMLITYLIGCVVIFGAFGIWRIVVTILNGVTN